MSKYLDVLYVILAPELVSPALVVTILEGSSGPEVVFLCLTVPLPPPDLGEAATSCWFGHDLAFYL